MKSAVAIGTRRCVSACAATPQDTAHNGAVAPWRGTHAACGVALGARRRTPRSVPRVWPAGETTCVVQCSVVILPGVYVRRLRCL